MKTLRFSASLSDSPVKERKGFRGMSSSSTNSYNLTHLKQLEAESIHIIREVAAEFENPVMLYSIGKDSAVMVRLAQKAFYPGRVPLPLMHVNTTWKFKDMITFRDRFVKENNLQLIEYINHEGLAAGASPLLSGRHKA